MLTPLDLICVCGGDPDKHAFEMVNYEFQFYFRYF